LILRKIIILLIAIIPFFLFQGCSETPTDAGAELLDRDKINVTSFDTSVDSAGISASYFKRTINLGASQRLLLGKKGNVEAGMLLKFNFLLPDTLSSQINNDSITVISSWVRMVQLYRYGADTDPLDLNVYNVTSGWTTGGFNSDSTLTYDNINQSTGYTVDDTTIINLQPQFVLSWLEAAADTAIPTDNGIYIKPADNSAKVLGYYAFGSAESFVPSLNVVLGKMNGDVDTVVYFPFADVSFVKGELPAVSVENIVVQGGLEVQSRLKFDLSSIPENVIVNKAEVVLTKDMDETLLGDNISNSIIGYFIIDTLNLDSLNRSVILNPSDSTYRGEVTLFVQEWIREKNRNSGLLLAASGRFNGVDLYVFKGPDAAHAERPRLIITYTVKQ